MRVGNTRAGAAMSLVIIAAAALLIYLQMRPPIAEVTDGRFTVQSMIYRVSLPVGEISDVSLDDSLPRVRRRTNGFAFGQVRTGYFTLRDGREARLFVKEGAPPFLLVRSARELVIVNFADASQTRALHTRLREAMPAK
jgi:hypothetical protein